MLFAANRDGQPPGKEVNPFFADVLVSLVAGSISRYGHDERMEIEPFRGTGERLVGQSVRGSILRTSVPNNDAICLLIRLLKQRSNRHAKCLGNGTQRSNGRLPIAQIGRA